MGLSGTKINATRSQLSTNENQIAMALGDGRMETATVITRGSNGEVHGPRAIAVIVGPHFRDSLGKSLRRED